jgi:hypothetical protein
MFEKLMVVILKFLRASMKLLTNYKNPFSNPFCWPPKVAHSTVATLTAFKKISISWNCSFNSCCINCLLAVCILIRHLLFCILSIDELCASCTPVEMERGWSPKLLLREGLYSTVHVEHRMQISSKIRKESHAVLYYPWSVC